MVVGMLWIAGVYGGCIGLLHLLSGQVRNRNKDRSSIVVCMTRNNENDLEWYIRSIRFLGQLRGRSAVIAIFDDQSNDQTLRIAEQAARELEDIEWYASTEQLDQFLERHEGEWVTIIQLGNVKHRGRLPLFQ